MKKLSDIPKKNVFEVPEGYFEKLPGVIQSRIAEKENAWAWNWSWGMSLRYALPALVIAAAGFFWYTGGTPRAIDVQAELAQIAPEQLADYLEQHDVLYDTDMSTEELVETAGWSNSDVDQLEQSVYAGYGATHQQIEKALDELDNEL